MFFVIYGKLQTLTKKGGLMKKLILLIAAIFLLASCQTEDPTPHKLSIDKDKTSYQYKVSGVEDEFTLYIPQLKTEDEEQAEPIYSLNPLIENKDGRKLTNSTFYKNDDVDTFTKDRVYNFARFGFGFWVLNDSGKTKQQANTPMTKDDYTLLFGDYYHQNDLDNQDFIKYYLATQELIWESITNPETGKTFQVDFTDIDVSEEKAQIREAQKEYGEGPFFGGTVMNVSQERLDEGTPFNLTDSHGVLDRFEIKATSDVEILESQEPNVLSFNLTGVSRNTKIEFVSPFKIKQEISQVYSSKDNVSYLTIGQDRSLVTTTSLHIEQETKSNTINLAIKTYDIETKLEIYGAQYHVSTGPEFLDPITTTVSEEGLPALLENLATGTYYIQQIQAPEGYALNQEVETISIKSGVQETTYPFYNTKK